MSKNRFTEEDLKKMGLIQNPDGTYSKGAKVKIVKFSAKKEDIAKCIDKIVEESKNRVPTKEWAEWMQSPHGPIKLDDDAIYDTFEQTGNFIYNTGHTNWEVVFDVDPLGKPRMTQSDKWKKRPATDRYWELKRHLKNIAGQYNFKMPECNYHMIFYIPMSKSWAPTKKEIMNGKPHQQKPDKDNLEKAVLDSLCEEDSYIWDGRVSKFWAYKGKIVIKSL